MAATSRRGRAHPDDRRRGLSLRTARVAEFPKVAVQEVPAYRADNMFAPPRNHHVIVICLEDSAHLYQERGGVHEAGPVLRGDVIIEPAGFGSRWHGDVPGHIRVALAASALCDAAFEWGLSGQTDLRLRNVFRVQDRFLRHAVVLLCHELHRPTHPAQILVADGLALALAGHLLSHYSVLRDAPLAQAPSGTRPAVRRALDYLHAHPAARLSLEDLAVAAGLSKHHFARAFRVETGMPPAQYVERMRIERAKRLLGGETSATVAEIAFELGFADHSHFTRRFRKHVGRTPTAFRNEQRRAPRAAADLATLASSIAA